MVPDLLLRYDHRGNSAQGLLILGLEFHYYNGLESESLYRLIRGVRGLLFRGYGLVKEVQDTVLQ